MRPRANHAAYIIRGNIPYFCSFSPSREFNIAYCVLPYWLVIYVALLAECDTLRHALDEASATADDARGGSSDTGGGETARSRSDKIKIKSLESKNRGETAKVSGVWHLARGTEKERRIFTYSYHMCVLLYIK